MGWHSKDDSLKFIVGKQPNPFYEETEMLWDADISPSGIIEQIRFDIAPQLAVSLLAGQLIFNDNPENAFYDGNGTAAEGTNVPGGDNHTDSYLGYQQILATFKVNNNLSFSAAPGYLFYPGHGGTDSPATATTTTVGSTALTSGGKTVTSGGTPVVVGSTVIPTSAVNPSSGGAGTGRGAGNA